MQSSPATAFEELTTMMANMRVVYHQMDMGPFVERLGLVPSMVYMKKKFCQWLFKRRMLSFDLQDQQGPTNFARHALRPMFVSYLFTQYSKQREGTLNVPLDLPIKWALYDSEQTFEGEQTIGMQCIKCASKKNVRTRWHRAVPGKHSGIHVKHPNPFKTARCNYGVEHHTCKAKPAEVEPECGGYMFPHVIGKQELGCNNIAGMMINFESLLNDPVLRQSFYKLIDHHVEAIVSALASDTESNRKKFQQAVIALDATDEAGELTPVTYNTFSFACSFVHPTPTMVEFVEECLRSYAIHGQIWSDTAADKRSLHLLRRLYVTVVLTSAVSLVSFTQHISREAYSKNLTLENFDCIGVRLEEKISTPAPCHNLECNCSFKLVKTFPPAGAACQNVFCCHS